MAKKKSKNRTSAPALGPVIDTAAALRLEWESIEVEFFAREADLYRVNPVESFEDLDSD